MRQSKKRRKQRERLLEAWRAELWTVLGDVRSQLQLMPDEVVPDQVLVAEVLELAHPETMPGVDAVVPAPRVDIAAEWFRARLERRADTAAERQDLARALAPAPDAGFRGRRPIGFSRDGVERAVRYWRDRR